MTASRQGKGRRLRVELGEEHLSRSDKERVCSNEGEEI